MDVSPHAAHKNPAQPHQPYATGLQPKAQRVSRGFEDGANFGRYSIVRLLGRGGMAEVYLAQHLGLKKPVALKVMRPGMADNLGARSHFLAEGESAARIRHPHVVDVTDVGEVDGLPYLVMELLQGEDLSQLFARKKHLPPGELVEIMLPVLSGVFAGHLRRVLHRDLKPGNILLHKEGPFLVPKVLDFGVSRVLPEGPAAHMSNHATVLGTPHYMAPEQARGEAAVDERSDQYSLGVILYEGATGCLPHDGENQTQLLQNVAFSSCLPPSARRQIDPLLERVILRAMSPQMSERFDSVLDLGEALLPLANESAKDAWYVATRQNTLPPGRRVCVPGGSLMPASTRTPFYQDKSASTAQAPENTKTTVEVKEAHRKTANRQPGAPIAFKTPLEGRSRAWIGWATALLLGSVGLWLGMSHLFARGPATTQVPTHASADNASDAPAVTPNKPSLSSARPAALAPADSASEAQAAAPNTAALGSAQSSAPAPTDTPSDAPAAASSASSVNSSPPSKFAPAVRSRGQEPTSVQEKTRAQGKRQAKVRSILRAKVPASSTATPSARKAAPALKVRVISEPAPKIRIIE